MKTAPNINCFCPQLTICEGPKAHYFLDPLMNLRNTKRYVLRLAGLLLLLFNVVLILFLACLLSTSVALALNFTQFATIIQVPMVVMSSVLDLRWFIVIPVGTAFCWSVVRTQKVEQDQRWVRIHLLSLRLVLLILVLATLLLLFSNIPRY